MMSGVNKFVVISKRPNKNMQVKVVVVKCTPQSQYR